MIRRRVPLRRMKPIERRLAGIACGGHDLQRAAVRSKIGSRMVDSKLERRNLEDLLLLERAGVIKDLKTQVTHQLYVGPSALTRAGIYTHALCSCQLPQGKPMPTGMKRIYAPRLDFQFYELHCRKDHAQDGTHWEDCWQLVYADAKGWFDPNSKQYIGYKLFAAIHGQEIRLYR